MKQQQDSKTLANAKKYWGSLTAKDRIELMGKYFPKEPPDYSFEPQVEHIYLSENPTTTPKETAPTEGKKEDIVNWTNDEGVANINLKELIDTLIGVTKALDRMIYKYNPDDIEAEWIGEANEAIFNATGKTLSQF